MNTGISDNKTNTVVSLRRGGGEMMKKLIVLGIVAVMVLGFALSASAATQSDWVVYMRAKVGTQAASNLQLGTKTGAFDSYTTTGGEDNVTTLGTGVKGVIESQIKTLCVLDRRTPMAGSVANPEGASAKTWNLKLWVGNAAADTDYTITLSAWNPAIGGLTGVAPTVKLKQGSTTLWTVVGGTTGNSVTPNYSGTFTLNSGPSGTNAITDLYIEAVVPEPGSMVAMLSGIIGLVGFGIRRRK